MISDRVPNENSAQAIICFSKSKLVYNDFCYNPENEKHIA